MVSREGSFWPEWCWDCPAAWTALRRLCCCRKWGMRLGVEYDDGAIDFKWSKSSGVTGYVVYYSTSKNGSYKKLATVKGTSYSTKKFDDADTYYFKVRAYTKTSDGNVYSAYSSVKSVTVK